MREFKKWSNFGIMNEQAGKITFTLPEAEMRQAWDFIENTSISVFLTGKAGTGKTTFLRYVTAHTSKTCVVTAPTGVAAINAGGVTLHSFFQLPLAPFLPGTTVKSNYKFSKEKLRIIRALDLLVIDEISMVRSDLLDNVDSVLRRLRGSVKPFGGVQLLLIGDLQQLAPVVTNRDEELLKGHYSTPFFFGSHALQQIPYVTIALQRVFRQQNPEYLQLLNNVRDNHLTSHDRERLNALWNPQFIPPDNEGYIRLTTHNHQADAYNLSRLSELSGQKVEFKAKIKGDFPESSFPTESTLTLKQGAQVMFIKNDNSAQRRFYNGKIGIVTSLDRKSVRVHCLADGEDIDVEPMIWENARYRVDEATNTVETHIEGTFSQLPLRLAWAITIHKSQGLTFNKIVIDAGKAFAPGQVYVALSRCRSLDGVVLHTPVSESKMMADHSVLAFIASRMKAAKDNDTHLAALKSEFKRNLIIELFSFNKIGEQIYHLKRFAGERLGKGGKSIAEILSDTEQTLQKSVTDIAIKWQSTLRQLSDTQLESESIRKRMENGIAYFLDRLHEEVVNPLKVLDKVKPVNKALSSRWQELYDEFEFACKSKIRVLDMMAGKPFAVEIYLKARREALLAESKSRKKMKRKS